MLLNDNFPIVTIFASNHQNNCAPSLVSTLKWHTDESKRNEIFIVIRTLPAIHCDHVLVARVADWALKTRLAVSIANEYPL